jgi:hypothetical protein
MVATIGDVISNERMRTIKNAIGVAIVICILGLVDLGTAMMSSIAISLILSILYLIEHIKADIMTEQRELIFHDTVPLAEEELPQARKKAGRQKDNILIIFKSNPNQWFSPYQIQDIYRMLFQPILITSVRRSITDLTKEGTGRIRKGSYSDQVKEKWHTKNNVWKFNPDYSPTLNPQK